MGTFTPISLLSAFLGCLLLWRGIWPRRRGEEPRCRRCDYELRGIENPRCPECGAPLEPAGVVRGSRSRRPVLISLGVVCLPPAPALHLTPFAQVDWYQYRPTAWVLADLDAQPALFDKAWQELTRRRKAGALTGKNQRFLIARCLLEQGKPDNVPIRSVMVDFLGQCLVDGVLTEREQTRFIDQIMKLSLRVRPRVMRGDSVPYDVNHSMRGPRGRGLWINLQTGELRLDGRVIPGGGGGSSHFSGSGSGILGSSFKCGQSGPHTLVVRMHLDVFEGPMGHEDQSRLHDERTVELEATFNVLGEADAPNLVLLNRPDLKEELHACIRPRIFSYNKFSDRRLDGWMEVIATPINTAFDVLVVADGVEHRIGSLHKRRGESAYSHVGTEIADWSHQTCRVILRSSKDVARQTLDLFEIWDGELRYDDIAIKIQADQP